MVDVAVPRSIFSLGGAEQESRLPEFWMGRRQQLPATRSDVAQQMTSSFGNGNSRITQQTAVPGEEHKQRGAGRAQTLTKASGDTLTQQLRGATGLTSTTAPSYSLLNDWSNLSPQANSTHRQHRQQTYGDCTAEAWPGLAQLSSSGFASYTHGRLQSSPPAPVIHITPTAAFRPQDSHLSFSPQQNLLTPYNMAYEQHVESVPVQHPVSPISHHSRAPSRGVSPLPEPLVRKRSFSQLEQHEQSPVGPAPAFVEDGRSVRVSRTIKRTDAPTNEHNKYICDVSTECAGLTFERKCEWSKHMDKHDRPYTCLDPGCAKLQGFTYSGGLLRHEREVHNKHGGPRARLMCPHVDCKRHTEKGFTRRENLQEHLRRVHAGRDHPQNDTTKAESLDTPASALSAEDPTELYALQRPTDDSTSQDVSELREQLQRLRAENEAKAAMIHRLEEDARVQNDRLVSLEQTISSMQQQQTV